MNGELERMRKEVIVTYFKAVYYPDICLRNWRKPRPRIAAKPAEVLNGDLPNTMQECESLAREMRTKFLPGSLKYLPRSSRGYEDNIKMNVTETMCDDVGLY